MGGGRSCVTAADTAAAALRDDGDLKASSPLPLPFHGNPMMQDQRGESVRR